MIAISCIAAALLSLTTAVHAQNSPPPGNAIIKNQCDFDVFVWSVVTGLPASPNPNPPTQILRAKSGVYTEQYQSRPTGGVSLKLSSSATDWGKITQFEYTLTQGGVFYDISNVNCDTDSCPFAAQGMFLESGLNCPNVTCAGADVPCTAAYLFPSDNQATKECGVSASTTLLLCATSGDGSSSGAAAPPPAPPASPPPPASSQAAGFIGASPGPHPVASPLADANAGISAAAVKSTPLPPPPAPAVESSSPPPSPVSPVSSVAPSPSTAAISSIAAVAPPATTPQPPPPDVDVQFVTVVTFTTEWETKFVERHADVHQRAQARSALHRHARRHGHH